MMTQENIPYTAKEIKVMVKTIESLRKTQKKYKEALDMAKKIYYNSEFKPDEAAVLSKHLLLLFPELKESEDERIRKGIIRNLQYLMDRSEGFVKEDLQERIAWLENQCEQKQTWKPSEAQLIVIKDLIEDKNTSKVNKVVLRGMFDEFKQFTNTHKREIDDAYLQGICDAKHEIEKQGESTETNIEIPFGASDSELQEVSYYIPEGFYAEIKDDRVVIKKVEPKFKVGDWVILNGIVAQILDKQKYGFVGLDIDGKDFFCNYGHTDSMRLWSIEDAKDGDVLSFYLEYKGNKMVQTGIIEKYVGKHGGCSNTFKVYVGVNWENNFQIGEYMGCPDIRPATKEQRDTLEMAMTNAGYRWDKEKLKLHEQKLL